MGSSRSKCSWIVAGVILLFVVGRPAVAGDATQGLQPVPLPRPDLTTLEPEVAEQLRQTRGTFDRLLESGGDAVELAERYAELGKLYHAYALIDAAGACYRNALQMAPERFAWHYLLGLLYRQAGDSERALHHLGQAIALRPDSALALVRRGDLHFPVGRLKEAKRDYLAALYLEPRGTAIIARLGEVALAEERFALARDYLTSAVEAVPQANRLNYLLAMVYRGLGDEVRSRELLRISGSTGVEPPDPLLDDVKDRVRGERLALIRGKTAYAAGLYGEAEVAFRAALAAAPESSRAMINLGSTLAALERSEEAEALFQSALQIEPGNSNAQYNLAILQLNRGAYADARTRLEAVLEADGEDPLVQLALARACGGEGNASCALEHYRIAARLDPGQAAVWLEGAGLLTQLDLYPEAIRVLRAARNHLPESGAVAYALARLLVTAPDAEQRSGDEAVELAATVYRSQPRHEHGEVLALALAEADRCEEAAQLQESLYRHSQASGAFDREALARMAEALQWMRERRPCRGFRLESK